MDRYPTVSLSEFLAEAQPSEYQAMVETMVDRWETLVEQSERLIEAARDMPQSPERDRLIVRIEGLRSDVWELVPHAEA